MAEDVEQLLTRWAQAGLIDLPLADRLRAFEAERRGPARWRWPTWMALGFGGLMLAAGVLLLVSAHWDAYSPAVQFAVVLALAGGLHVAAAFSGSAHPAVATTLHAVGTIACGAGIFLGGQIFNLAEHWPGGVMLWAIAAGAAWVLLRQWPQLALTAMLVPGWLLSEWTLANQRAVIGAGRVAAAGTCLLALAYFSAVRRDEATITRRVLRWIGGVALLPSALSLAVMGSLERHSSTAGSGNGLMAIGWTVALALPLLVAASLHRLGAWTQLAATIWVVVLLTAQSHVAPELLYVWWAVGAAAVVAWGVRDGRSERINMGAAIFAGTVVAFYLSELMTKLGRSASLIGLGVLFLAGGWVLERTRRHFIRQTREQAS